MYQYDETVYQQIIELVVDDWKRLEDTGIELCGQGKVFPVVLGNKGDWSYLVSGTSSNTFFMFFQRFRNHGLMMFHCLII